MSPLAQSEVQAVGHEPETATVTLSDLLAVARGDGDTRQIEEAYSAAAAWHDGQWRRSGDPHISHSLAVALIVAELGLGTAAVCAALLHDVIEDTPCTPALLRSQFGDEIADLVDQVMELDSEDFGAATGPKRHAALVIKLADRLHNMRTLSFILPEKQQRKSREVLDHFAPLANTLGLDQIGAELASLAAAVLNVPGSQADVMRFEDRRGPGLSRRLLAGAAMLLPAHARDRWLEEWVGEISYISSKHGRARFTVQMLAGMPRLAAALRWPIRAA
ncbi:MAG TPA: HD domain-containing protein [Streptosporangiaceae bacterium]|jgi:GTP pyrophosphokinase